MSFATTLLPRTSRWPKELKRRLGDTEPWALHVIGPANLLEGRRIALFCSARSSGGAVLPAHDAARRFRDAGVTMIGGFHSQLEKECLEILLRGRQPIIICPGRAIESMRIPPAFRPAFDAGRLLFLSPFIEEPRRVTRQSALRRNEIVAALADEAYIAHIEKGGSTEQIVKRLREWNVPIL